MEPFEYEKQIKAARDRGEVVSSAAFTIQAAVSVIASTLIQEHAPSEVEAASADIVEAGQHARSTLRTVTDLGEQLKAQAKGLGAISKEVDKIEYASRKLFAPLLARADAKRKDGGRFRTSQELWTSAALDPLPELEPQREVLFAAYEETYQATPKPEKKPRAKKGAAS